MNQSRLPIAADVIADLRRVAELLYPLDGYGPSATQYDAHRSGGMRKSNALMDQCFGRFNRSRENWDAVLRTAGLTYPPTEDQIYATKRINELRSGEFETLAWSEREEGEIGLPVIRYKRLVIKWQRVRGENGYYFDYAPVAGKKEGEYLFVENYMVR